MKPLMLIYWVRAGLGFVIGVLCAIYVYFSVQSELGSYYTLLTGVSFAMLFYIATYYLIKLKFFAKVEKPRKLATQGIGVYFFAWIVMWTLLVTLLLPSVSVSIYIGNTGNLASGQQFWVVARNNANQIVQNVTTVSGTLRMALLTPGTYTFELGNTNQSQTVKLSWAESLTLSFNVS